MIDLGTGRRSSSLAPVTLSLDEMQLLIQLLQLVELPTVLMAGDRYDHVDELNKAMTAARTTLEERGLLSGNTVQEDLEERLRAVGRPHWVINMRLYVGATVSGACLAKGDNNVYTLALRGPQSYVVHEVRGDDLTGSVITALPQAAPLDFNGINIPTEQIAQIFERAGDPAAIANELRSLGVEARAAAAIGRAFARKTLHATMIGLIYGDGNRDIAPGHVSVIDTLDGRIVATSTIGQDGAEWSTLSSGTPARLRQALHTLIGSLPDRQAFPIQPGF